MKYILLAVLLVGCASKQIGNPNIVKVTNPPADVKAHSTLELYVSPQEAARFLALHPGTFFIDVRTPEELKFIGVAQGMDINIPFLLNDISEFSKKSGNFGYFKNPSFESQLLEALKSNKVSKDDVIFVMCRSGARAAKAINILSSLGYKQSYNIVHGFEGDKRKQGNVGARTINGWKNTGQPWSYKTKKSTLLFSN